MTDRPFTTVRRPSSRDTRIGVVVTALATGAMAIDHLMGDDPGLEDPVMFAVAAGLSVALGAFLFGRVIPRAIAAAQTARDGLLCSALAVVPGIGTLWLGLPFVLAGAGVALGLHARRAGSGTRSIAAIGIGALVLVVATGAYLVQMVNKLA
jgi:hypothetical protein